MLLAIENKIRGCIPSVMADRYFEFLNQRRKFGEETIGLHFDAITLYGWTVSQPSPCKDFTEDESSTQNEIFETGVYAEIKYFVNVDLIYPNSIRDKIKIFHSVQKTRKQMLTVHRI